MTDTLAITLTLDATDVVLKVELFGQVVPKTVANFKNLCLNADTVKTYHDNTKARNYKDSKFYKIVSGFFAIGGDIINNDGTGGEADSGMLLADENFILKVSYNLEICLYRTILNVARIRF